MNDICIVDRGPAGLATALALRQRGFTVTVVDCAVPPIDNACGEGLSVAFKHDPALGEARVAFTFPRRGENVKDLRFRGGLLRFDSGLENAMPLFVQQHLAD